MSILQKDITAPEGSYPNAASNGAKVTPISKSGAIKFSVERSQILRALSHIQSVVEKRSTIPVLSNVKIEIEGDNLRLTATDMEISITETIPVKAAAKGATTLPAQVLYDIIRKLPEGSEVEFNEAKSGQVEVKSGRSKFKLLSLPIDTFPALEQNDLPHSFTLAAKDMRALIDKVRFAISNEETRYYLNGIYLHTGEENGVAVLRTASTDGHRLARVSVNLPQGAAEIPGVIIPKKTVNELRKLLAEYQGDIEVSLSETKIIFSFGDAVVSSKLIDGKFPDYDRVIPKNNDKILEVNSKEFAEAAARVEVINFLQESLNQSTTSFPRPEIHIHGEYEKLLHEKFALETEDIFAANLFDSRYDDSANGRTASGTHKTDFHIINTAKNTAAHLNSTGEQKALLLAIILGLARLLKTRKSKTPIILLDEVIAHLDQHRRAELFTEILSLSCQCFMTGTEKTLFTGVKASLLQVENSRIITG